MLLSQQVNSRFDLSRVKELPLQQYGRGDKISTSDSDIWQVYRGVVQLIDILLLLKQRYARGF